MKKRGSTPADAAELRRLAEHRLEEKSTRSEPNSQPEESKRLIHELQVHQIELELQNEQLQQSRADLEAGLQSYSDLYDFAPMGYVTLDSGGAIRKVNIAGARLLGVERARLVGARFGVFVSPECHPTFNAFLQKVFDSHAKEVCELGLCPEQNPPLWVHIGAVASGEGVRECRAILTDISRRKQVDTYREMGREVLQILNEPGDIHASMQGVLAVLKTRIGCNAVGIRLQEGDDFPYFAQDGFSNQFLSKENTLVERDAGGGICKDNNGNVSLECTCGLVIAGKTAATNSLFTPGGSIWSSGPSPSRDSPPSEDPRRNPRNRCIHQGYASVALVPIRNQDGNVGLIQINDRRKGAFTIETVERLESIASHIGVALTRKRADREAATRESQARLATFAAATFEGIVESDGTRIVDCNEQFARMLGYSVAELRGAEWTGLLAPDDRDQVMSIIRQGQESTIEHSMLLKDGTRIVVEAHSGPVFTGSPTRHIAVRDITERKRLEEERERLIDDLRSAQKQVSADLDAMTRLQTLGLLFLREGNLEPVLVEIVDAAIAISGADFGNIQILDPESSRLKIVAQRGFPTWWPTPLMSRSGEPLGMFSTHYRSPRRPEDRALRLLDLLARQAADIIERAQSESALNVANAQLMETDRRKNEFMAVLSHELRNPLAPIRNSTYILERSAPGGEQARRAVAVIDRQAGQLARLVDDLLDVTRITRNKVQLQRQTVDLNQLVRHAMEDQRSLFERSEVHLHFHPAPRPVLVNADRNRLAQVIGNLLQNAAKFTGQGGETHITISADATGKRAVVQVADTGVGMAPEMVSRLFQPFSQADSTLDRSKGGLGLGLALAKGLVELHGGTIAAASAGLGQGAEFVVRLPLAMEAAASPQPSESAAKNRRRVLIIEDNIDAADSLRDVLAFGDHEVEVAYNGPQGIAKAQEFLPEVVLCDIGLPGMDGYEVARAFRADEALKGTFLAALSGYALPEDLQRASEAGFDRHIPKPPSIEQIAQVLEAVRTQPAAGNASVLHAEKRTQ
jgi:PAS domain S-box-containing protein